jgi:hypothetical protein
MLFTTAPAIELRSNCQQCRFIKPLICLPLLGLSMGGFLMISQLFQGLHFAIGLDNCLTAAFDLIRQGEPLLLQLRLLGPKLSHVSVHLGKSRDIDGARSGRRAALALQSPQFFFYLSQLHLKLGVSPMCFGQMRMPFVASQLA